MYQNLPVYRANKANPNPNGSLPFRLVPGLRAANLPPSPVTFAVGEAAAAPVHAVAAPAPQAALPAPQAALPAPQQPQQPQQPPQGPLLPAPVPVLNPRTLLQKPHIQSTILEFLTFCHVNLYAPIIQSTIYNAMTENGRQVYHSFHAQGVPLNPTNLYKLIVKGGNTTVLLEERTAFGRAMNRRNFPLSFINDLDVSLLI